MGVTVDMGIGLLMHLGTAMDAVMDVNGYVNEFGDQWGRVVIQWVGSYICGRGLVFIRRRIHG
jgi:hypothetical protein